MEHQHFNGGIQTMPRFIACYDLERTTPAPHAQFLLEATARGWSCWERVRNEYWRLPNTTLTGNFASAADATARFDEALAATRTAIQGLVNLEKRYVIQTAETGLIDSNDRRPIA